MNLIYMIRLGVFQNIKLFEMLFWPWPFWLFSLETTKFPNISCFCSIHVINNNSRGLTFPYICANRQDQCSVFFVQYEVCSWSEQCTACSVQCAMCSVQCAVCSFQCEVWSVKCAVCSVQCAVCSLQCAVCSVQFAVCSVQCHCAMFIAQCAIHTA